MAIKPRVLFLCTENSCRTQMAEAFLRELTGDELEIVSAGAEAGRLDPEAVAAMREVGIDISRRPFRRLRRRSTGRCTRRNPAQHGTVGRLHSRGASGL